MKANSSFVPCPLSFAKPEKSVVLQRTRDKGKTAERAMPAFKFEAMDTTGSEVKDSIDAINEEEAQQKIKQMGYFVTKLTVVGTAKGKGAKGKGAQGGGKG